MELKRKKTFFAIEQQPFFVIILRVATSSNTFQSIQQPAVMHPPDSLLMRASLSFLNYSCKMDISACFSSSGEGFERFKLR